jgi:hypothetical protein
MRRAISWVYCDPKSRITIVEVSTLPIVNGESLQTSVGDVCFGPSFYFFLP